MAYLTRRVGSMVVVLILLSLIVFIIIRIKGDPVMHLVPATATMEEIAQLRRAYGFDRPLLTQYWDFLRELIRGDFGHSFRYRADAMPLVVERIPVTAQLAALAILIAVSIALPLGVLSAIKRNSPTDFVATTASVLGRAMPDYWVGIMLMLVFAVSLRWVPVSGYGTLAHMVLPAVTLGGSLATTLTRLVRSSMLEVMGQEYIMTARSKGLSERRVMYKHALRNALIPVITVFGLQMAWLLGGATIIEEVFALPGMGRLIIQAVKTRDMAVVQAGVFVFAVAVMSINFAVDVLYTLINPQIRYG